jgi:Flp pilus assembly protein TadB
MARNPDRYARWLRPFSFGVWYLLLFAFLISSALLSPLMAIFASSLCGMLLCWYYFFVVREDIDPYYL